MKLNHYDSFITIWCKASAVYYKRAAFILIASIEIHQNTVYIEQIRKYLHLIQRYAEDDREQVKKRYRGHCVKSANAIWNVKSWLL